MGDKSVAFLYMSPAGTTRKTGREICSVLSENGYAVNEINLAEYHGNENAAYEKISESSLLVVGSPVYADHILIPMEPFLSSLPAGGGKPAIMFVTYGEVATGVSLNQLYEFLKQKKYRVVGAAEVLSVHSMLFRESNPVGAGHPNNEDFEAVRLMAEKALPNLESGSSLDSSIFKPRKLERFLAATCFNDRFMSHFYPRISIDPGKCSSCGVCSKLCPVGRLDDPPTFDETKNCLFCYMCVRSCPEGVFDAPMWMAPPVVKTFRYLMGKRQSQATRMYV